MFSLARSTDEAPEESFFPKFKFLPKLDCGSDVYVEKIFDKFCLAFSGVIDRYDLSEEQKKNCLKKFSERFKKMLSVSITIRNISWYLPKEISSRSLEKEMEVKIINEEIFPKLQFEMVRTARRRKTYPDQCSRLFEQSLKYQLQRLKSQEIDLPISQDLDEIISDEMCNQIMSPVAAIKEFSLKQKLMHMELLKHRKILKNGKDDSTNVEKICSKERETYFCDVHNSLDSTFLSIKDGFVPSII